MTKVWYSLKNDEVDFVEIASDAVVAELRDAIIAKNPPLQSLSPGSIKIYASGTTSLEPENVIDPGDPVPARTTSKNPLIVVAPPPQQQEHESAIGQQRQQQQQEQQNLLRSLVYIHGSRNGADPAKFRDRVPATNILKLLPLSVDAFQEDEAITRVLLFGPPASGKTSIMGKIFVTLKERFPSTPVYFVRAAELKTLQQKVIVAIASVQTCVVLLDDAQAWYSCSDFFALFKGTRRLLVAAATYSAEQFNPDTPVDFQRREKSNLVEGEVIPLLESLQVNQAHHRDMSWWFGDVYGRFHILVPTLLSRWADLRRSNTKVTLAETFFHAATMEDPGGVRFLPQLSSEMRKLMLKIWRGTANKGECKRLIPYGILDENADWSCEYVRRKYFLDLFHDKDPDHTLFDANQDLPHELDLAMKGFQELNWNQLRMCAGSSNSGFPVEDIWQAEFYGAIGRFVPRHLTFCKEFAVTTGNRSGSVDFVLRNGSTRAIEFLIKSSDVAGHHERFEKGAYKSLCLSGSYLVVDIKPWDSFPDLLNVANSQVLQVANNCFLDMTACRRMHHAVFLISDDLSSGILYAFDTSTGGAKEYGRSP